MHTFIRQIVSRGGWFSQSYGEMIADEVVKHIRTPEFAALYRGQVHPLPDLGLGQSVNQSWSTAMSALTDAMAAAITTLKSQTGAGGPTTEEITAQIHGVIDPQVADLTAKINAIAAGEADDASKVADIQAALTEFTTAFAPAAPASGEASAA